MGQYGRQKYTYKKEMEQGAIMVDESPDFAMKLPGAIKIRREPENIRESWNLLMSTLGIVIVFEENVKWVDFQGTRIQKVKEQG